MKNTKAEIISAYNQLLEQDLQMERINAFLTKFGLKIEDVRKLIEIVLSEDKNENGK